MKKKLFKAFQPLSLIVLSLLSAHLTQAQANFKKLYAQAEALYEIENYKEALPKFLEADRVKAGDPAVNFRIGECYYFMKDQIDAVKYYEVAYKANYQHKDLDLLYHLGVAYQFAHDFQKAKALLVEFRDKFKPEDEEDRKEAEDVAARIQACQYGEEYVKNPVKVKIKNLGPGINTKDNEYMPAISADETVIYFTSRRENTTGGKIPKGEVEHYEDIYTSVRSDTVWTASTHITGGINSEIHDACAGISPDGQKMIIYKLPNTHAQFGDLYLSELKGNVWTDPKTFGLNINSPDWEPSGTISSDERTLIFTSNRKNAIGHEHDCDLYFSKRQDNGEWGKPVLLSSKINTRFDEDGPFLHHDGKTLYFSSKGHKSMGGYDIFKVEINLETGEVLTEPENVGYPINTADDDIFFSWSTDGKRAYFSSERPGGYGQKDIYMMEFEEALDADLVVFKGIIKSCKNGEPLAATIKVTDLTTQKLLGVYNSNAKTGKYTVILPAGKNYGIAVEAQHHLFFSKNVDIPKLDTYKEINDEICLNRLEKGGTIVLRNVFFDVDKATLRPESEDELERLLEYMVVNPSMKIEVAGHTDSDGSDEHNLKLSDNRAHAVRDYLMSKGVKGERMVWKGYGETEPMAPNDSPENKQLNRRTEVKILEE